MFCKKSCSWKFHIFHRKTPAPESLFNEVTGQPATLLKKRLWHKCFPVNFVKFSRTPFSQNTSRRLLLLLTYLESFNESYTLISTNKLFVHLGLIHMRWAGLCGLAYISEMKKACWKKIILITKFFSGNFCVLKLPEGCGNFILLYKLICFTTSWNFCLHD